MKVTVARTLDDFMKVMVIRGIIFIGEHGHRYNMESAKYFCPFIHNPTICSPSAPKVILPTGEL